MNRAMVDHVLKVTVDAEGARGAGLAETLAVSGFTLRSSRGRLIAESTVIEAQEAKAHLRALGFEDREYRIHVEFSRQWGFL